jgi:hypothetical protein
MTLKNQQKDNILVWSQGLRVPHMMKLFIGDINIFSISPISFPDEGDSGNLEFVREVTKFRPIIANYYSGRDSKMLIGIVSRRCNISRATPILIRWSCDMMNLHRQIQIPHIRHEDNRSADFLANLTLTPSFIDTYVLETLVVSFIITYLKTYPEYT